MHQYPVFLRLEGKRCLVVGAGEVGLRKISTLLQARPSSILVLDTTAATKKRPAVLQDAAVDLHSRPFTPEDVRGMFLAIAATSSPAVNMAVADACDEQGVLCNIADAPQRSSFIVPSTVRRGDLTLAISTGGNSPALAKRLRRDLENQFGPEYQVFIELMGRIRPLLLSLGKATDDNSDIFRRLVTSDLLSALAQEDLDSAAQHLRNILPVDMHDKIGELLHGNT